MRNLEYWGLDSTTPITHYALRVTYRCSDK